jgi:hypothetical protein
MKIKCLNKINWRPKELNPIFIEKLHMGYDTAVV